MADPIAALIVDIGADTSKLVTGTEQAVHALDQFAAQTVKVDESVMKTSGAFSDLDKGLSSVDKTLGLLGVRLGPEIQAVRELGTAAGKTATEIGTIGTAGLAVAAGLAGWKVGRMIADYFDLDDAISNSVATLMNWGDVAAQTGAAKMEMLSRASVTAGRAITDLSEAMRINRDAADAFADAQEEAAKKATAAWQKSLDEMNARADEMEQFRGRLLGDDAVENAIKYMGTLQVLHEQGLKPVKAVHEEIVTALRAGAAAMEDLGQTGQRMYRELIALANEYSGLLPNGKLESGRITMGLAQAPDAGPNTSEMIADAHRQIAAQAELVEWIDRYNTGLEETDRLIKVYNDTQTSATSSAVDGVSRVIDKYHEWHSVIQEVSSAMSVKLPNTMEDYLRVTGQRNVGISDTTITRALTDRGTPLGIGGGGVTVNMNGLILSSDPSARQAISDAVMHGVKNSRKF